jgi:hypothetical protein
MRKAVAKFDGLAKSLELAVSKHNESCNKGGATYKEAPEPSATGIKRKASDQAEPATALEISDKNKDTIGGFVVNHPSGDFELIFNEEGTELYLNALKDNTLDPSMDLGCVQGARCVTHVLQWLTRRFDLTHTTLQCGVASVSSQFSVSCPLMWLVAQHLAHRFFQGRCTSAGLDEERQPVGRVELVRHEHIGCGTGLQGR